jgi:hypothetical protein
MTAYFTRFPNTSNQREQFAIQLFFYLPNVRAYMGYNMIYRLHSKRSICSVLVFILHLKIFTQPHVAIAAISHNRVTALNHQSYPAHMPGHGPSQTIRERIANTWASDWQY